MVIVNVFISKKGFLNFKKSVEQTTKRAVNYLKKDNVSIDLFLVSDKEIKSINNEFRSKNKITNVLSFENNEKIPHPELPKGVKYLGEIYLAPDYIKKQKQDINFLVIHGLLHLLGYTHERKNDKIIMEQKELRILSRIKDF